MARKPRELRNVIIDCGDMDAPAETTAPKGRPPGSETIDYADMDALIDFWQENSRRLSQRVLIDLIRHFYKQRHGRRPSETTIKTRINP